MQFPQHVLTPAQRVVLAVAPFTLAALLASPAEAAGPRPFFQMPFACGQTWEASTYDGHWPDQDSIDLGEWTAGDANMSKGEPVLASADGKVLDVFTNPAGDIRVYLDHGDGWVTHYIHLEQVPPLTVGPEGRARANRSGASATAAPSSTTFITRNWLTASPCESRSTAR